MNSRVGGEGLSLQTEPVHGGADPVVLGQVLDGADSRHGGAAIVDVLGAHILDILGCHSLQTCIKTL